MPRPARLSRHARLLCPPNAQVRTTWFDGTVEDFAARASPRRKMTLGSPTEALDYAGAALQIKRIARALVEKPALIFEKADCTLRPASSSIRFSIAVLSRASSRLPAAGSSARLRASFSATRCRRSIPRDPLPVSWDIVKSLRPSYKFIGYTQVKRGYKVNPELLGDDRPDLLEAFYAREQKWLETGR